MTDPDQPSPMNAKGRFQPGNKIGRGRPKGVPNTFGPGFRERLLAGISRAGEKKAKKAGVNSKVDGITYYLEHLADTNGAATASIISKLIPPEAPPPELSGSPTAIIINPVLSGNMYAPGQTVLLPYDECGEAWTAYRSGEKAWQAYLLKVKPQLTVEAFESLSYVPPPEPNSDKVVPLRQLAPPHHGGDDVAKVVLPHPVDSANEDDEWEWVEEDDDSDRRQ